MGSRDGTTCKNSTISISCAHLVSLFPLSLFCFLSDKGLLHQFLVFICQNFFSNLTLLSPSTTFSWSPFSRCYLSALNLHITFLSPLPWYSSLWKLCFINRVQNVSSATSCLGCRGHVKTYLYLSFLVFKIGIEMVTWLHGCDDMR